MSLITTILGTVALSFFGFKIVQFLLTLVVTLRRLVYIRRHLPGPKPHWLYGNLRDPGFNEPGFEWEQKAVSKYRRLLVFWMGWKPVVMLNHPDSIKPLLATNIGIKSDDYQVFKEWSEGLGLLEGAIWKRHRTLITPSFHFQVLKQYLVVMNEALDVLIDKLHVAADQGEPVKTHETMSLLSLDVILRCAFSHQSHCQETESREVEVLEKLTTICAYRVFHPLMFYDCIFRLSSKYRDWKEGCAYMHGIHDKIVAERRRTYATEKEAEKRRMDFLDTLLLAQDSDGNGLSKKEIRDEVNQFVFAGTDTTGSALTWFLYIMAQHPDEQARIQEEVDTLFAGRDDDSVQYEDLKKLTYITQCLRESMRMYVYVPPFRVLREPLKVNDFTIPAGTVVAANTYQLHHNPDVWGDDHMDFKPDRFERTNVEKRDPFAFVPFSAGARNCLGQQFAMDEMRSTAARIFRRFSVSLVKGARPVFQIVTKPDNEILVKFIHR
ncbi:ultra-long-chain fatty acid omega-hydroxylase-like [Diadema antillarum]|uniref:ultra-long-chain fatty acid omega-hydroxylase-like n=1 Tax=Diadema antillarum TaxID=105358 RepID=UPI003A860AD0